MKAINQIHPTIKFTFNNNLADKSTTYLDTKISIINNKIETDLYRKETDRIQYLLPSSCHPTHIFNNIPYSLALRLVRICSQKENLKIRLEELKVMLLSRNYRKNIVNAAIDKALNTPRIEALKKVVKNKTDRVIFAVTYHPMLPSISTILAKHWKSMTRNPDTLKAFPQPPMVAYRQPPNLKKMLVHAKLPSTSRDKRVQIGAHKCGKQPCKMCTYVTNSKTFKSSTTGITYNHKNELTCQTKGVVYLITCTKCKKQYVGQTSKSCETRFGQHIYYVGKFMEATGTHFNLKGHTQANISVTVIEKVTPCTPMFLLEREDYWIRTLKTKAPNGLNIM